MSYTSQLDKFDNAPPEIREMYHRVNTIPDTDIVISRALVNSHEFCQIANDFKWWWMQPPWSRDYSNLDHSLLVVDLRIVS